MVKQIEGIPLVKQGFTEMEDRRYHAHWAINSSSLKEALDCTAADYYYNSPLNPNYSSVPSDPKTMGSAFHAMLLEPETFYDRFYISPKVNRATTMGKLIATTFEERADGKEILSADNFWTMYDIFKVFADMPTTHALFQKGVAEQAMFWQEEVDLPNPDFGAEPMKTKLWCRAKVDYARWVDTACGRVLMIVDLKTINDFKNVRSVARTVADRRYDIQAAHYIKGAQTIVGEDVPVIFVLVFQEKKAPHKILPVRLEQDILEVGEKRRQSCLTQVAEWYHLYGCEEPWPAFDDCLHMMTSDMMPNYWNYI